MSAAARPAALPSAPSRWLFGPGIDVFLGYGAAYLISVPLLVALSLRGIGTPAEWVPAALALVVSIPHYGATLLRVYQRPDDRSKYAVFTVWITLAVAALFGTALWAPIVGSLLLTLYVTWSPWHFSGQNYGLFLMYLRRSGHDPQAIKRPLYLSFVLAASVAIVAMHMSAAAGSFAPNAEDRSLTYTMLRLGIPMPVAIAAAVAAGAGWLACMATVLVRLRGVVGLGEAAPLLVLVAMQALWYLPSLAGVTGIFDPARAGFAFTAIWIAVAHAAQYLWVTYYYARREGRQRTVAAFYGQALLAGCVILSPMLLLAPGMFGSIAPGAAGITVLTLSVLNLHHFILDGAIWKLRDGRVARVLLRDEAAPTPEPIEPRRRIRPLAAAVWVLALASLATQVALVRLYASATREGLEAAAMVRTTRALAWLGQDSQGLWAKTGRALERAGDDRSALAAYRRAVSFGRPPPWVASRAVALVLDGPAGDDPRALAEAQRMAQYVVNQVGEARPEVYQPLAAAHARSGNWDRASEVAERGIEVAEGHGRADVADALRRQVAAYHARESGGASSSPLGPDGEPGAELTAPY